MKQGVGLLRDLSKADQVRALVRQIHEVERRGDAAYYRCLEEIYKDKDPLRIMQLKELLEDLEAAVDGCENASTCLRTSSCRTGDAMLTVLVIVVLTALAFDFINGFHDTANAVATVISTGVLPARTAILIAAVLNFGGALVSTKVADFISKSMVELRADSSLALFTVQGVDPVLGALLVIFAGAARGEHLEPHHLVLRHPVQLVARAARRDRRLGLVRARRQRHQDGRRLESLGAALPLSADRICGSVLRDGPCLLDLA